VACRLLLLLLRSSSVRRVCGARPVPHTLLLLWGRACPVRTLQRLKQEPPHSRGCCPCGARLDDGGPGVQSAEAVLHQGVTCGALL